MGDETLFITVDRIDTVVAELRKYPGWPQDDVKDRVFADEILGSFPSVDVLKEISAWRIWMMDHEQRKEVRPRARLNNWLRGARGDFRGRTGSQGPRNGRTSTTARPREAFGDSSAALARW